MTIHRRSLVVDPVLWDRAKAASMQESLQTKRTVSISEWIRESMRQRLQPKPAGGAGGSLRLGSAIHEKICGCPSPVELELYRKSEGEYGVRCAACGVDCEEVKDYGAGPGQP